MKVPAIHIKHPKRMLLGVKSVFSITLFGYTLELLKNIYVDMYEKHD